MKTTTTKKTVREIKSLRTEARGKGAARNAFCRCCRCCRCRRGF